MWPLLLWLRAVVKRERTIQSSIFIAEQEAGGPLFIHKPTSSSISSSGRGRVACAWDIEWWLLKSSSASTSREAI